MGFQTPQFFLLTAAGFCLFWAVKGRKLLVLAVFDCLFYLYAGLLDFGLFFGASVLSYVSSQGMRGRKRKAFFAFGLGINLLNLAFFKYYYFTLGNLSKIARIPAAFSSLRVVLPIGISFYTFQLIAYLVDVYRDDMHPIASFIEFWVFISFFGQVIAGPIMRAKDFAPQVARTEGLPFDMEEVRKGLVQFGIGLAKKLVLADSLSPLVEKYFQKGVGMSSVDVWIAAYLFAFQIYYDFSAYSDMALGVGRFFGFKLTRNFDTPYISQNPVEFWRRWHITLSTWVRDYLYIPMGGSRKGFARGLVAVIAAMCISGLWHGASWTFVLWGLYHGLLCAFHRVWRKTAGKRLQGGALLRTLNTLGFFQLTAIGWVFFRVTDAKDLGPLLAKMLTFSAPGVGPHFVQYGSLVAGLCGLHLAEYLAYKHGSRLWEWWNQCVPPLVRALAYSAAVLLVCVYLRPKTSAFIYFQF